MKESVNSSQAWAIWISGLPGSGKTVLARKVKDLLLQKDLTPKILELDKIRKVITPDPTYSDSERDIVYFSLAYMAKLLIDIGQNVIIDATGCKLRYRELARQMITNFAEVYLDCSLEICMKREQDRKAQYSPDNIYKKSQEEGATVPGVNVPYEKSPDPEIVVNTARLDVGKSAQKIVQKLERLFL